MSGKVRRYVSLFVLGSLLFAISLFVLARLVITPERIRATFVPVVERLLECDVNLEAIDVTLFSGVTLANLELLNSDDGAMILAADKVVLRYQLLPLFAQRVVVDEIRLLHPRLNVERLSDGHFNYQDLFDGKSKTSQTAINAAAPQNSDIDILISHLYIEGGELLFKDYSFGHAPHRYKLTDFDLHLTDFSLQNDFKFELWGKVNGAALDVEGSINLVEDRFDIQLIVDQLDLVQFQPYYRDEINGRIDALKIGVNARIRGEHNSLHSNGIVTFVQLDYSSAALSDLLLQANEVEAKYDVTIDSQQQNVVIEKLNLTYDGISATLDGHLSFAASVPDVDLHLSVPNWTLRKGHALLPRSLATIFSSYDLAGEIDIDVILRGKSSLGAKLIQQSSINLDSVQVSVNNLRPSISGTITTTGAALSTNDMVLVVGDNALHMGLSSDNIWARRATVQSAITADVLDFKKMSSGLRSEFSNSDDISSRGAVSLREITEPGPVILPFDILGTVFVEKARLQQLELTALQGNFSLRNNIFEYDSLSAAVAGGRFDSSGDINLTRQGFAYSGHVVARKIQLDQILRAVDVGDKSTINGVLATTFDYRGAGTQKLRVQQNLSADGVFDIDDGSMSGTALMDEVATVLDLEELHIFRFSQADGKFNLKTGGQLQYDAQFMGSRSRLHPVGTWQSDGTITAELAVYLAPELAAKIDSNAKVLPYFQQRDGWSYIPFSVRGSLEEPTLRINVDKAGRSALRNVGDVIVDELQHRAGRDSAQPADNAGVDLIESALKGVLGN